MARRDIRVRADLSIIGMLSYIANANDALTFKCRTKDVSGPWHQKVFEPFPASARNAVEGILAQVLGIHIVEKSSTLCTTQFRGSIRYRLNKFVEIEFAGQ